MSNDNKIMDKELRTAASIGDVARLETAIGAGANLESRDWVRCGVGWGVVRCGVVWWSGVG